MIAVTPEKVRKDIAAVRALSQLNDHIRAHFSEEPDLSADAGRLGAASYIEARRHITEPVQWRVFSHCASVTRLYALYEGFVYELVAAWLKAAPSLYKVYGRLPEAIVNQHRVGVGVLLQKFGAGARTEHLTELRIVQPLYSGLSGDQGFELVPEAFFIDLRNLRHQELCGLFKRASLENLGAWLHGHTGLKDLCDAAGTTVDARLNELIEFRNEAAHARQDIDETLGVSAFEEIAEFVQILCAALHEFVVIRYVDVLQEGGRLELLGSVTEYLPHPDASILTTASAVRIGVGDDVIAQGARTCFAAKITSLQDNGQPVGTLNVGGEYEVGVRSEPSLAREGLRVYRLRPSEDEPVERAASQAAIPDGGAEAPLPPPIESVVPEVPEDRGPEGASEGDKRTWLAIALSKLLRLFR